MNEYFFYRLYKAKKEIKDIHIKLKELSTDKKKLYSDIRKLNDEIVYFEKYAIEYSFKIEVWDISSRFIFFWKNFF